MLLSIITLLAGIGTTLFLVFTKICNDWYDFWMVIVSFIVLWIIAAVFVVLCIFLSTLFINKKKEYKEDSKFYRFLIKITCEMLIEFFRVDVNIRGLDKVPEDKAVFLVQNHNSYIDPIISIWSLRFLKLSYVMKKEIMKAPFVSHALYRCNFPALDRENNREALKTILQTVKTLQEGKNSVGIFPEGTRSKDGELHEFRPGSFKIPEKAGCPIVISVLKNTREIKKNWPLKKTQVYFDIIDVIYPEQYKDVNTSELSDNIHLMMKNRLEELKELDKK